MNRIISQMKEQLGWQGMSGLVLLILAGAFLTLSLDPLEEETAMMRGRIEAVRGKGAGDGKPFGTGDRQDELASFYESLPEEGEVTDMLASVYAVAEAASVELKQAEYHLDDKDSPRVEYVVNFPMRGEYTRIRAFLSRVLADNPAMALDQISFQRDRIGDGVLNANVKMTLFIRPFK